MCREQRPFESRMLFNQCGASAPWLGGIMPPVRAPVSPPHPCGEERLSAGAQ